MHCFIALTTTALGPVGSAGSAYAVDVVEPVGSVGSVTIDCLCITFPEVCEAVGDGWWCAGWPYGVDGAGSRVPDAFIPAYRRRSILQCEKARMV
jgi:hypothetical protein